MSLKAYNPNSDPMNPARGYIDNLRLRNAALEKHLSSRVEEIAALKGLLAEAKECFSALRTPNGLAERIDVAIANPLL